jgi:hypothetical protein
MNIYFIDPTYVKPEGWRPLLAFLKVKVAYSFISTSKLPSSLYEIIRPYLIASYSNQDKKIFSDNCAFWLREHLEKHIRLITMDYKNTNDVPKEELKKYSSFFAYNNIINLDDENCLVLLTLHSSFDETGIIDAPYSYWGNSMEDVEDMPTHVVKYCLNILHKKYEHNQYDIQSAFVCFDRYFWNSYRYIPKYKRWDWYYIKLTNGKSVDLMSFVNLGVMKNAPELFPIREVDGKRMFTPLRSEEGDMKLKELFQKARKVRDEYERWQRIEAEDSEWPSIVEEWNRDFWNECGEAGSNCDSWPGWG